ncbi:hypothetical protein QTO34_009314 [Cnephaeus nilssonii]|uniref:Myosin motor domain-containing protein n=1 Tax=Cnephaeus nilssonii TaxID=3371016 RepID=A0AA40HHM2_CNENI|nr:hypothetical protein QTO34_009314 [Eptesicus nilssonii]
MQTGEKTELYSVIGFIDKNKDTLFQDFKRLMYNRQPKFLVALFRQGLKKKKKKTGEAKMAAEVNG